MSTTVRQQDAQGSHQPAKGTAARLAVAWTVVGVPLAYGIFETARKAAALFTG
jgi:hypothetical protein